MQKEFLTSADINIMISSTRLPERSLQLQDEIAIPYATISKFTYEKTDEESNDYVISVYNHFNHCIYSIFLNGVSQNYPQSIIKMFQVKYSEWLNRNEDKKPIEDFSNVKTDWLVLDKKTNELIKFKNVSQNVVLDNIMMLENGDISNYLICEKSVE